MNENEGLGNISMDRFKQLFDQGFFSGHSHKFTGKQGKTLKCKICKKTPNEIRKDWK